MSDISNDIIERYAKGERLFRELWIEDFSPLILDHMNLSGIDMSDSFLLGSFKNANLSKSTFRNSNLKTCDFSGADLSFADFRNTALEETNFAGAQLTGALFEGSHLWGRTMVDGDMPDW